MNKDEKIIDFLIAHKNNLWTALLILVSGLAGLVLTMPFSKWNLSSEIIPKMGLFICGIFLFSLIITGLINVNNEIKQKLK
ncbi:MAG: hypothetical protein PHC64_05770 [Candidatus Gastranaerophilales bacterium]|nr:hypothetical protein [Candidatus Gastranaerophilales bacterium]